MAFDRLGVLKVAAVALAIVLVVACMALAPSTSSAGDADDPAVAAIEQQEELAQQVAPAASAIETPVDPDEMPVVTDPGPEDETVAAETAEEPVAADAVAVGVDEPEPFGEGPDQAASMDQRDGSALGDPDGQAPDPSSEASAETAADAEGASAEVAANADARTDDIPPTPPSDPAVTVGPSDAQPSAAPEASADPQTAAEDAGAAGPDAAAAAEDVAAGPEAGFLFVDRSEVPVGQHQTVAVVFTDPEADVVSARLVLTAPDGSERAYDAAALIRDAALFEFDVWEEGVFVVSYVEVAYHGGDLVGRTLLGAGIPVPPAFSVVADVADVSLRAAAGEVVSTVLYAGDDEASELSETPAEDLPAADDRPHFNLGYDGILTIALDPGHGGEDWGASTDDLCEKDLNWKVANLCKEILEAKGVTCVLTREEDECPTLVQRAVVAHDANADFYVSIHFNALEGSSVHGVEVYYPTDQTSWRLFETSVPGKDLADKVFEKLVALGLEGRGVYDRILHPSDPDNGGSFAYPGNPNDTADYYGLIREPRQFGIPAIVVEHAYITSPIDAALLADETMLEKMAQADAEAILECYEGAEKLEPEVPPAYDQFADCPSTHWVFKEGWLKYVVETGMMTGMRALDGKYTGYFEPDSNVTRGQVATIIYRYANPDSDATTNKEHYGVSETFTDVDSSQYYTAAIEWCYKNKIITGYTGEGGVELHLFGPDDPITREQLGTMMYRYVKACGVDVSVGGAKAQQFAAMPDASDVSDYADDAMAWCFANGVITGDKSYDPARINPAASATRAHIAKIVTVVTRDLLK